MDKTELIKILNEIEETAKHEEKWGKNPKYYKGVLDCVKTIKTAMGGGKMTYREITECCPHCGDENTWGNAPIEQKWGYCQTCGKILHFCDECMFNNNDTCNPKLPTAYCHEHYIKELKERGNHNETYGNS